jgi:1-acyl-sn-glycerol-3-phosphate acyltransferase
MPDLYEPIVKATRVLVRFFFRRVEVTGLEHIPQDGGGILVSWHPNGMIDPGLILTHFPRQVVFGARHGLFNTPVLGWVMRNLGVVPVFRAQDAGGASPEERRAANQKSLQALAKEVASGRFSCLFPEGDSHDLPYLLELKSGAARFYYQARQLQEPGTPVPVIIPVGLHYDHKRSFRSSVHVAFHPPLELAPALDLTPQLNEDSGSARERCRELTGVIEQALQDVVHATESWELHKLMHRVRKLVRAERAIRAGQDPGKVRIGERTLGFARVRTAYNERAASHPEEVTRIQARIANYDADLRALGMEDHELDRGPQLTSKSMAAILVHQVILVFVVLPPLVLLGWVINLPVAIGLWILSKTLAAKRKDEASIKVLFGVVAFPLTWAVAGVLAAWGHTQLAAWVPGVPDTPGLAALVTVACGVIGGVVALRYLRVARETARSVRVRFTRARQRVTLARLKTERGEIHDVLMGFIEGLALPGQVAEDGRVVRDG